jgi:hypothetical protein
MLINRLATLSCLAVLACFTAGPASALTMAECSAKYNAAKDAGTLGGLKWNDFRKAECGPGASATAAAAPAKTTKAATSAGATDEAAKGLTMAECSAKYNAAKDAGTLGGLKWNDFRKAECGPGASATATAAPAKTTKAATSAGATDEAAKGLTMAECSAKYNAAKDAGTLGGLKWNDFRKAECGPGASATAAAAPAKTTKTTATTADTAKGLTMAECSAKYQAAKAGGSLNGMKWNDFRKASCGANAADDDTVPAADEANYTSEPDAPTTVAPRGLKFPTAISRKFSSETPGKARMHTCLEQYYANKDADSLGGIRWIQKGGGYYSLCNARLKADS